MLLCVNQCLNLKGIDHANVVALVCDAGEESGMRLGGEDMVGCRRSAWGRFPPTQEDH